MQGIGVPGSGLLLSLALLLWVAPGGRGWMVETAGTPGLDMLGTLLFLRDSFLLLHSYPAWALLDVLHGKYVNEILCLWVNLKMCRERAQAQKLLYNL